MKETSQETIALIVVALVAAHAVIYALKPILFGALSTWLLKKGSIKWAMRFRHGATD